MIKLLIIFLKKSFIKCLLLNFYCLANDRDVIFLDFVWNKMVAIVILYMFIYPCTKKNSHMSLILHCVIILKPVSFIYALWVKCLSLVYLGWSITVRWVLQIRGWPDSLLDCHTAYTYWHICTSTVYDSLYFLRKLE